MPRMKKLLACLAAWSFVGLGSFARAETNSYVYDALGRLVAVQSDLAAPEKDVSIYFLDAAGNRSQVIAVRASFQITPIFRYVKSNARHFYSSAFLEGTGAGFRIEGPGFKLFRNGGNGLIALYRCYVPTGDHHFMSLDAGCEGTNNEGIIGYIASAADDGLVPLYRFYRAANDDHLITIDYAEAVKGGHVSEGTMGYVPL